MVGWYAEHENVVTQVARETCIYSVRFIVLFFIIDRYWMEEAVNWREVPVHKRALNIYVEAGVREGV